MSNIQRTPHHQLVPICEQLLGNPYVSFAAITELSTTHPSRKGGDSLFLYLQIHLSGMNYSSWLDLHRILRVFI